MVPHMDANQTPSEGLLGEIRAQLARRQLHAQDLADACGIARSTMYRKLRGEVPLTVPELVRVADFLGVSPSTLLAESAA